ncbi:MAG: protein-disulfide reductase DsbD [Thalassolituus sp.]|jgi:thiol:disulfide interchange protein DsbD
MRTGFWLLLFSLCLPAQASLLDSLNSNDAEFLPVEQAFPVTTNASPGVVSAEWQSVDGYYLYQHRIYLKQNKQRIDPVSWSKDGKEKYDEAFGDIIAYYGDLTVTFDTRELTPGAATLHYQGCADAGLCYPPQTLAVEVIESSAIQETSPASNATPANSTTSWFEGRSTLAVLGIFFLLGLGLTFTPCVLPMVPILTSVVLGGGNTPPARGFWLSFVYVTGMAITYAAAGLAVGLLGAGANVQALMQSPPVLIGFAVLFLVLSLAMFGVYELQLPSGLRNRLNNISQKQNGGNAVSVFIIGVLSALVVSPCVSAPLAGALAYLSTTGDAFAGALALLALGFGMGTPLIVLGTTGATVLPKAGAWMNRIKYLFGFMLVGVAIWLVSRLLPGPLVLALWGALAVAVGIVAGALSSPTESAQRWLKTPALMIFIYGVVAIAGALQGNSDLLNPIGESTHSESEAPFVKTTSIAEINTLITESQQPVMVDLYADWCISCKVMDEEIFAQEDAQLALRHLLWVQLDLTDNTEEHKAFMNTHGVFGPPTVLFFEAGSDNSQGRIIGERRKSEFVQEALGIIPAP